MSETLRLPEGLRRQIIEHCLSELPNEGCGLIASDDKDRLTAVYPTRNADGSPTGFTVPPEDHYAALEDAESRGWELAGVFHSHPRGPARPSMTDVLAANDPQWIYLVVGLEPKPEVRAWRIRDAEVKEVRLA